MGEKITFDQIRKGDRIRARATDIVREGVADQKASPGQWRTEDGYTLAQNGDIIELLDRPVLRFEVGDLVAVGQDALGGLAPMAGKRFVGKVVEVRPNGSRYRFLVDEVWPRVWTDKYYIEPEHIAKIGVAPDA